MYLFDNFIEKNKLTDRKPNQIIGCNKMKKKVKNSAVLVYF